MTARPHHPPDREAGFTLVEVLISMFIFSLISIGALIALTATLDARERAEAAITRIEELAAARRIMADDFAAITWRQNRDGLGGMIEGLELDPSIDVMTLTRRGRPNPDGVFPRGDLLRVSWRVESGQLIRAFLPHENPAYVEPPIDRVILDGVETMAFKVLLADTVLEGIGQTMDEFNGDPIGTGFADMREFQPQSVESWGVDILLTHNDGTTTRYMFELPNG